MHFGRKLLAKRYEPWKDHYLDYNSLKTLLEGEDEVVSPDFVILLNEQVELVVHFFLQQQGQISAQICTLRPQLVQLHQQMQMQMQASSSSSSSSASSSSLSTITLQDWMILYEKYKDAATLTLHLVHYLNLNVTGIRKILKKHDKITGQKLSHMYLHPSHPSNSNSNNNRNGGNFFGMSQQQQQPDQQAVLRPLLEDGGIEALYVSLEHAFHVLYTMKRMHMQQQQQQQQQQRYPPALERWNTWSDSEHGNKFEDEEQQQEADNKNGWAQEGGEEEESSSLLHAQSSKSERHYSSIASTADTTTTSTPMSSSHDSIIVTQPVIILQIEAARRQLRQTSDFVHMLAAPLILERTPSEQEAEEEEATAGAAAPKSKARVISNYLNFCSTFLHMTDYYIVAPTSGMYAARLGDTAAMAGLIIGLNSISALVSTILYSWWTSYSYKHALVFASSCQLLGCVVYAMALPMNSMTMVIVGRLIGGFGSARSINRRYIADTYPTQERTAASASFVTAGALGTSAGPAAAALLYLTVPKTSENPYWQVENAPGFTMATLWTIYVSMLLYYFQDPPRMKQASNVKPQEKSISDNDTENQKLLEDSVRTNGSASESNADIPLWKSIPVCTTFVVYFTLKFILESLLSSTAILTDYYFGWQGSYSGVYMAILGLLVLPANWVIAVASQMYDDRELILATQSLMFLGCIVILQYKDTYTVLHYLMGSILIFVSCNALEGPNMSLLSKTIPPRYRKGLFNVGLLATESGTLGRAVGDVILTMCGSQGMSHILNNAFGAMSMLSFGTIALTLWVYDKLQPGENDD